MFINPKIIDFLRNPSDTKDKYIFSVYAICKNEIKNVREWVAQFDKCDYICILDTGSKDGTYEELQELAKSDKRLIVSQKRYENFHYDEARNDAYDLIPYCTDVCITLDFDERLQSNWFDNLCKQYGEVLTTRILHIERKMYENGFHTDKADNRILSHPYLKDNKVFTWRGYSGENIVYGYNEPLSLEEINKKFVIYNTIYTNSIFCNHYLQVNTINTIIKGLDGKKKCIEFFNDTHKLIMKENNFIKLISLLQSRLIDYKSFIIIFSNYTNISDEFLRDELDHLIDIINQQKLDLSDLSSSLLSFILDGILKQRGIIFRDFISEKVFKICQLLIDYASDKEKIEYSIKAIKKEQDAIYIKETEEFKAPVMGQL